MAKNSGEKTKNSRLLRLISPKINSLLQRVSTQLYPQYEARRGSLQLSPLEGDVKN